MAERRATVSDVHQIAAEMPHTTRIEGPKGNAIYQVGGKSFVFFRTPRPDARDPDSGEPYKDIIIIWVGSEAEKNALVQAAAAPSSPPRTSTVTYRCWCASRSCTASGATNSPNSSKMRGCRARRRDAAQHGWHSAGWTPESGARNWSQRENSKHQ